MLNPWATLNLKLKAICPFISHLAQSLQLAGPSSNSPKFYFLMSELLFQISFSSLRSKPSLELYSPSSCLDSFQKSEPFPKTQDSCRDKIQDNIKIKRNVSLWYKLHKSKYFIAQTCAGGVKKGLLRATATPSPYKLKSKDWILLAFEA